LLQDTGVCFAVEAGGFPLETARLRGGYYCWNNLKKAAALGSVSRYIRRRGEVALELTALDSASNAAEEGDLEGPMLTAPCCYLCR
jgi:hypothetical protein